MIRTIQKFTQRYYLRGLPNILYRTRRFIIPADNVITTVEGVRLLIKRDDYFNNMAIYNYLNTYMLMFLRNVLLLGDTIIDVGANFGQIAVIGKKLVGRKGRVFAVEPDTNVIKTLKRNVEINQLELGDITVVDGAFSDTDGRADFHQSKQSVFSTLSPAANKYITTIGVITVGTQRIDTFLAAQAIINVRLIKIDVEGFEQHVLQGASELIGKGDTIFIVEHHPYALMCNNCNLDDLLRLFPVNKYAAFALAEQEGLFYKRKLRLLPLTDPVYLAFAKRMIIDIVMLPAGLRDSVENFVMKGSS